MGKFQTYPAYKDSGVEWIGKVPIDWEVVRLAHCFTMNNAGEVIDKTYWGDGNEILYTCNRDSMPSDFSDFPKWKRTSNIDLLLTRNGTPYVHKPIANAIYSNVVQRIRLKESLDRNFLTYTLGNSAGNLRGYGVSIESLNFEMWKNLRYCLPDYTTQKRLVVFLDHETAKIDRLIAKQERLIELLKEKRQAVISHAVTKGLNPDAPMKDSGVEWLGEVPAHWEVSRLKYFSRTTKGLAFKSEDFVEEGAAVVKATDIKSKTIFPPKTYISWDLAESCKTVELATGDVLMSTVGSIPDVKNSAVGQVGMVPPEYDGSYLNQNTVRLEFNSKQSSNFLFLALQAQHVRDHLDLHAHGTANQASLSLVDILNAVILLPNKAEQREVNEMVLERLQKIDKTIVLSEQSIALLQEHRTALISAAVTGKIDVRGWQKPNTEPKETAAAVNA